MSDGGRQNGDARHAAAGRDASTTWPWGLGDPPPLAVAVRPERAGDEDAIRALNDAAFEGTAEGRIVDDVRADAPDGFHSLVAVDEGGQVVGHVLLSPASVVRADGTVAGVVLALGPIAVLPAVQFRGVGSALMAAAAGLAIARGAPAIVLLGHPAYYPRFGFTSARAAGLLPPVDWPDDAWLVRRLPAWTEALAGTVRYHPAFGIA